MSSDNNHVTIFVQTNLQSGPVVPQGVSEDFSKLTKEKLQQLGDMVQSSCSALVDQISNIANSPSEISIEFGIDVGAEGSVPFISKGSIGANFKVAVTWKKAES